MIAHYNNFHYFWCYINIMASNYAENTIFKVRN